MTVHDFAYPPFRMKLSEAARYCGLSPSSFLRAVENGEFPEGHTAKGGRFWLRSDLEKAMLDHTGNVMSRNSSHDFCQKI